MLKMSTLDIKNVALAAVAYETVRKTCHRESIRSPWASCCDLGQLLLQHFNTFTGGDYTQDILALHLEGAFGYNIHTTLDTFLRHVIPNDTVPRQAVVFPHISFLASLPGVPDIPGYSRPAALLLATLPLLETQHQPKIQNKEEVVRSILSTPPPTDKDAEAVYEKLSDSIVALTKKPPDPTDLVLAIFQYSAPTPDRAMAIVLRLLSEHATVTIKSFLSTPYNIPPQDDVWKNVLSDYVQLVGKENLPGPKQKPNPSEWDALPTEYKKKPKKKRGDSPLSKKYTSFSCPLEFGEMDAYNVSELLYDPTKHQDCDTVLNYIKLYKNDSLITATREILQVMYYHHTLAKGDELLLYFYVVGSILGSWKTPPRFATLKATLDHLYGCRDQKNIKQACVDHITNYLRRVTVAPFPIRGYFGFAGDKVHLITRNATAETIIHHENFSANGVTFVEDDTTDELQVSINMCTLAPNLKMSHMFTPAGVPNTYCLGSFV